MEESSKAKSTAVVVAVLALVVGGGVGFLLGNQGGNDNTGDTATTQQTNSEVAPDTATPAADLRALLNNLETEHVSLAAAATRQGFNSGDLEDPQFVAAAGSLDKNSNDLADAVGSVYGDEARARFYEIWASHIGFFVDYTVAAKTGDQAGMDKAVQNLNGYVEAISDFFSKANPNLPKDAVAQLITEHVGLLKATVDNHGAGDFKASYAKEDETRTQITTIADAIAGAIVKQNPDKF